MAVLTSSLTFSLAAKSHAQDPGLALEQKLGYDFATIVQQFCKTEHDGKLVPFDSENSTEESKKICSAKAELIKALTYSNSEYKKIQTNLMLSTDQRARITTQEARRGEMFASTLLGELKARNDIRPSIEIGDQNTKSQLQEMNDFFHTEREIDQELLQASAQ